LWQAALLAEAGWLADKVLLLTRSERIADRKLAGRFDRHASSTGR